MRCDIRVQLTAQNGIIIHLAILGLLLLLSWVAAAGFCVWIDDIQHTNVHCTMYMCFYQNTTTHMQWIWYTYYITEYHVNLLRIVWRRCKRVPTLFCICASQPLRWIQFSSISSSHMQAAQHTLFIAAHVCIMQSILCVFKRCSRIIFSAIYSGLSSFICTSAVWVRVHYDLMMMFRMGQGTALSCTLIN